MGQSQLSHDDKKDVALALIFLKDLEDDGDAIRVSRLAKHLGVYPELKLLLDEIPAMRVARRCSNRDCHRQAKQQFCCVACARQHFGRARGRPADFSNLVHVQDGHSPGCNRREKRRITDHA